MIEHEEQQQMIIQETVEHTVSDNHELLDWWSLVFVPLIIVLIPLIINRKRKKKND